MKNRRQIIMSMLENDARKAKLLDALHDYPDDSPMWLEIGLRLTFLDELNDSIDGKINEIKTLPEGFRQVLVEYTEESINASKAVSSAVITNTLLERIDTNIIHPAKEAMELANAEAKQIREDDSMLMERIIKRMTWLVLLGILFLILMFYVGYRFGVARRLDSDPKQFEQSTLNTQPDPQEQKLKLPPKPQPQQPKPKQKIMATKDRVLDVDLIGILNVKIDHLGDPGARVSVSQAVWNAECENNTAYRVGSYYICSQYVDF